MRIPSAPARLNASRLSRIALVAIEPAVLGGGAEHRVFAADLVGERGHAERVFHAADDIEIRHARLDHHHVGPFGDVEGDFADRFVGVGRVHLIRAFVAAARFAAEPTASRNGP